MRLAVVVAIIAASLAALVVTLTGPDPLVAGDAEWLGRCRTPIIGAVVHRKTI